MSDLVPIVAPSAPQGPPTLRELAPKFLVWFKFMRERAEHTVTSYGFDLRTFLEFCDRAGLVWSGQVTYRQIEMYLAWLRHERGLKPTSVNRHLHCLRAFWKWLVREGLTPTNPAADVALLKTPGRLPTWLPIYEQELVLTELAKDQTLLGRRDYALIAVLLLCGLRCSEVATLKVEDVDVQAGTFRVVGKGNRQRPGVIIPRLQRILSEYLTTTRPALAVCRPRAHLRRTYGRQRRGRVWSAEIKTGGRCIKFSTQTADKVLAGARLAERLAGLEVQQPSAYVFLRAHPRGSRFAAKAGRPMVPRAVYRIVRERLSKILGRPLGPHTLRHSMASRMRENGAPLELVQEALGHRDIGTTTIYAHITDAKRKRDIARYLDGGSAPAEP
jgi:site-specific recombinase XerD